MYVQVRDNRGVESFIEEAVLESAILSGAIVAFRRSEGWIDVPVEAIRGQSTEPDNSYRGQERRRSLLGRRKRSIPSKPVTDLE